LARADRTSVQRGPWSICVVSAMVVVFLLATPNISSAQAFQQLQPDQQPTSIKGTVLNAITHAPIARALVYSPDNRLAALTDGEGNFSFALPKPDSNDVTSYNGGLVGLTARKPGFLNDPKDRRQAETSGSEFTITIPLVPEALIKGRVISSDADPTPGITVQLYSRQVQDGTPRWVQMGSTRANSNGEFRFAELLPGTYKLMTTEWMDNDPATTIPGGQQFGFPPVYYPGVSDFAAAGTIQLSAGQTVQADLPLTRQPYYPVTIPLANADLNGGLNITVSVQGHRGPGYSLGYNGQTQRIEGLLPNGNYLVEAASYSQNPANGSAHLAVAGAPAEGSSMTLTPNSSITVHVTEEFNATNSEESSATFTRVGGNSFSLRGPRAYLQINAEAADDFEPQVAWLRPPTGLSDDAIVLDNLKPGRYWLHFHSSRGYVAAATMGGVDVLHQPLIVAPGSSTPIEVTMRDDTAELDGTVAGVTQPTIAGSTMSSVIPQRQAWIYCVPLPDSTGQFQQIWVSPDGTMISSQMTPGSYRVLAFADQQPKLPYRDAEAMRAYESKGQVVHLSAGQKTSVQLQLISGIE
jgi:hypothetical protein